MSDKIREYQTPEITIQYSLKRCIHAEECIHRLNQVFDAKRRPWIQPDQAAADHIAETIPHCPTGALHYVRHDDGAPEMTPTANTIRIVAEGPHYLRGDLALVAPDGIITPETRLALCRCGASENKPFCDNSHHAVRFTHNGTVSPEHYQISEIAGGGKLIITPTLNGSVKLEGDFEITDASGAVIYRGSKTWLCRCGHSENKPFCDGSHKRVGFVADGR